MKLLSSILSTMSLFRLLVWSGRRKHNSVGAFTFVSQQHQQLQQQCSRSGVRKYATVSSSTQSRDPSLSSSRFFAPQQHSLHHHPHRKQQSRLFAQQNVASSFQQDLIQVKQQVDLAMELLEKNQKSATAPDLLQGFVADLEREQLNPDFWDDANSARATAVNAQLSEYSRLLARLTQWKQWSGDCQAALEMLQEDKENTIADGGLSVEEQQMLLQELQDTTKQLLQDGEKYELELLLSGPYDHAPARIILTAGAGGTEANDWVADLKRMYERHASKMGFTCTIEDSQDGDVVGYKSVDMLITGPRAYGWFQGEKGAHRLVRLSPFNSNNKRQTTFAGVDVAPEVLNEDDLKEITIPDKDVEITTMRSGGAGGQNVNKVDSAVRIKHLPSGLQVKCTQERSQSMNRDIAMRRLKAQLLAIAKEQRVKEIKEIRGDMVEASWGAQIRNYVLHPYKMVKDQRTGWETSNAQAFLDGELLDDCIGAYLRYKVEKEEADNQS
jgi:peptide chain release factor 2